jgi:hypothetical protein
VGTSYQTLLVVGEATHVRAALAEIGVDAWVLPAGPGRVAVLPREEEYSYAHVDQLAASLTTRTGGEMLTNVVFDSDVVLMNVYRAGQCVHEYVSRQEALVDWFIDDDGESWFRVGGVEYPASAPTPSGPSGADPDALAPFGVDPVDLARLGALLRGELSNEDERLFAERHHRSILTAMNLDPSGLTTAFRWTEPGDLPGAVRVHAVTPRG